MTANAKTSYPQQMGKINAGTSVELPSMAQTYMQTTDLVSLQSD
jgi:hypothetical protein